MGTYTVAFFARNCKEASVLSETGWPHGKDKFFSEESRLLATQPQIILYKM